MIVGEGETDHLSTSPKIVENYGYKNRVLFPLSTAIGSRKFRRSKAVLRSILLLSIREKL